MKKYLIIVALLAVMPLYGFTCGADTSREDARDVRVTCGGRPGPGCTDKSEPGIIAFNNHYPNVENKCDGHGHRLFVMTHDSARGRNLLVLPDPTCPGYVKGQEPSVTVTGG